VRGNIGTEHGLSFHKSQKYSKKYELLSLLLKALKAFLISKNQPLDAQIALKRRFFVICYHF
jgi:hypothetical protein